MNQLKDCTFSPKINDSRGQRHFTKFLKEQRDHSLHKKEEIQFLSKELQNEELKYIRKTPSICKLSEKIIQEKSRDNSISSTFNRLSQNLNINVHPNRHARTASQQANYVFFTRFM